MQITTKRPGKHKTLSKREALSYHKCWKWTVHTLSQMLKMNSTDSYHKCWKWTVQTTEKSITCCQWIRPFHEEHTVESIIQHHHRTEFTFHNSYVILELVPSTVIFWTERSCWRKSSWHKVTLLLGWCHSNMRSSSRSGWPSRNINISNDNGSFSFFVDIFFPLSSTRLLSDLNIWVTRRVS